MLRTDNAYEKDLKKNKIIIIGGMLLSGLFIFVGILTLDFLLILISIPLIILFIYALIRMGRFARKEIKDYIPKKGFQYLRKTQSERLQYYTRVQYFLGIALAIIVIILVFLHFSLAYKVAIFGCVGLFGINFLKTRLKSHVPIDDATYFDLKNMGIIGEQDVVISIYKDFETWDKLKEGRKILIVTQDSLVCVDYKSIEEATKIICPLSKIEKLEMMGTGKGEGYLLVIGYGNDFINIKLFGDSSHDSPEEFLACFLKELDRCLLGEESSEIRYPYSNSTDISSNSINDPRNNDHPRINDPRTNDLRINNPRINDPRTNDPRINDPRINNSYIDSEVSSHASMQSKMPYSTASNGTCTNCGTQIYNNMQTCPVCGILTNTQSQGLLKRVTPTLISTLLKRLTASAILWFCYSGIQLLIAYILFCIALTTGEWELTDIKSIIIYGALGGINLWGAVITLKSKKSIITNYSGIVTSNRISFTTIIVYIWNGSVIWGLLETKIVLLYLIALPFIAVFIIDLFFIKLFVIRNRDKFLELEKAQIPDTSY